MIRLVTFLGNPGKQYRLTRHNLPWLIAERVSESESLRWQSKFKGEYAQIGHGTSATYLHKPLTFMNRSGHSVSEIKAFYKIKVNEILIVHDDVEMEPGNIAVKFGGGLGGHNGLRSVVSTLGSQDFYRFRIGVGRPEKGTVSSHVLKKLSQEEMDEFEPVIADATRLLVELSKNEGNIGDYLNR